MVRLLDVHSIISIVQKHGIGTVLTDMMTRLRTDFADWDNFQMMARPAFHVPDGVIELMPVCGADRFAYKYVNGHPKNPEKFDKQTVVATGQLSNVADGYPIMITEMSVITALRTAGVSALASDILSRPDSKTIALIGTGAQSEYQAIAHKLIRPITEIRYFDTDPNAMTKFHANMGSNLAGNTTTLTPCADVQSAISGADIIIVCTACKAHAEVIKQDWLTAGQHINGLGGDCPGKTELQPSILTMDNAKVVVEYFTQSFIEGEIQHYDEPTARTIVHAELHEIINAQKSARTTADEITIFDGVGIALEDYSALNVIYDLAERYDIGQNVTMIPPIDDPKNLFGLLV